MNTTAISAGTHHASETLGLWEPKRTLTLEAARRHSRRVKFMQRILLTVSVLLILALIFQFATQAPIIIQEDNPTESVRMMYPRYSGRTEDALPFYLTAQSATRMLANRTEVILDKPVLEFLREDGAASSFINAESGTYDDVNKILNLRAEVDLKTDDGNICVTTHARIFAREKRIEGDERIECQGNFGTANGNAYEINDNYKVFVFKNGMDAIIAQETAAGGPVSDGDQP